MKNSLLTLVAFLACSLSTPSQATILLSDNFDLYTDGNLSGQGGWTGITGSNGSGNLNVVSGHLQFGAPGIDLTHTFSEGAGNPSMTYAGFDLNVTSATEAGDIFLGFTNNANSIRTSMSIASSGSGYVLGFRSGSSGTISYNAVPLDFNTTYRIIYRYDMVSGSNNNTGLFYIDPISNEESENTSAIDLAAFAGGFEWGSGFGDIMLRQGGATTGAVINLFDNLIVATTFGEAANVVAAVPEPASIAFLLAGFSLLGLLVRRYR